MHLLTAGVAQHALPGGEREGRPARRRGSCQEYLDDDGLANSNGENLLSTTLEGRRSRNYVTNFALKIAQVAYPRLFAPARLSAEDSELACYNLRRRVRLRGRSYFAACRTVNETYLLLTMPRRYASLLNAQFGNRLLPFPLEVPAYDTYVYWHANATGDPANAWLRRQLIAAWRTGAPAARPSCVASRRPRA